jgi:hypothetical protein
MFHPPKTNASITVFLTAPCSPFLQFCPEIYIPSADVSGSPYQSSGDSLLGSSHSSSSTLLNHWDFLANNHQQQRHHGKLRSALKSRSQPNPGTKAKRLVSFADYKDSPERPQAAKNLGSASSPGQLSSRGNTKKPPPSPPMDPSKERPLDWDVERTPYDETMLQRRSSSPTTNRSILHSSSTSQSNHDNAATPPATQKKRELFDASTSSPLPVYKVFGNILEVNHFCTWNEPFP